MNITISKSALVSALTDAQVFTSKKTSLAVLSNVKIEAKNQDVIIEANDSQNSIREKIEAFSIDQDGEFLVNCADLLNFVKLCKDDLVDIHVENGKMSLRHSKGKADFPIGGVEEFPAHKVDDITSTFKVSSEYLIKAIAQGQPFVSTDEFRPQMCHIYAFIKDGNFGYCATDTRSLITNSFEVEQPGATDVNWYITAPNAKLISDICKRATEITISIAPKCVMYSTENTIIYTLPIQNKYPDFNRIIPQSSVVFAKVNKAELQDSVARVKTIAKRDDNEQIKLTFNSEGISISCVSSTFTQSAEEKVQCEVNGEITIGVNGAYMERCLKVIQSEDVELLLNDSTHPIMLKDEQQSALVVLCMPMTIQ